MIRINLLPTELRPIKRTPVPHILSLLAVAGVIAALLFFFMGMQRSVAATQAKLDDTNAQYAKLKDTVEKYEKLVKQKASLDERIQVINEILNDRIIWSEHLARLVSLMPKNVWLSDIAVTTQTFPISKPKIDPVTKKEAEDPVTHKLIYELVQDKRLVLSVSGYAVNDETGEPNVGPFTVATTTNPEFTKVFTLSRPKLTITDFKGFAVRGFTLEYQIQTIESAKALADAQKASGAAK